MPSQTKTKTDVKPKVATKSQEPVVSASPVASTTPVASTKQTGGKNMKGGKNVSVPPVVSSPAVSSPVVSSPAVSSPAVASSVVSVETKQKGGKAKKTELKNASQPVQSEQPEEQQGGKKKQVRQAKAVKTVNGGKKVEKQSEEKEDSGDKRMRSFKVKLPGEEDYCGRFTGLTPYQAANKALSKYYRDHKDTGVSIITFTIKESTRGSKRSEYVYNGKREKLAEPVRYPIQNKDGEVKTITKSFKNKLTKVKKAELTSQALSA